MVFVLLSCCRLLFPSSPLFPPCFLCHADNQPHDPVVLGAFSLDKISEHTPFGRLPLRISVVAHGPTKIIRIVDTRIR